MAKKNSRIAGNVTFTENDNKGSMVVAISGVTLRIQNFHIPTIGDRSAADGSSPGGTLESNKCGTWKMGDYSISYW